MENTKIVSRTTMALFMILILEECGNVFPRSLLSERVEDADLVTNASRSKVTDETKSRGSEVRAEFIDQH